LTPGDPKGDDLRIEGHGRNRPLEAAGNPSADGPQPLLVQALPKQAAAPTIARVVNGWLETHDEVRRFRCHPDFPDADARQ
jgi:hypothetical protein